MTSRRSFVATAAAAVAPSPLPARRPNIVIVVMDDFGVGQFAPLARRLRPASFDPAFSAFLRRRGAAYTAEQALDFAVRAMPTLSELERGGAVFTNAFASSNLCAPSRTGLLTGRLQNRFGHYQNIDVEGSGLRPGMVLAGRLREAGYATGFIGKWHAGTRDESLRAGVLARHGLSGAALAALEAAKRQVVEREIRETGYLGAVVRDHHPLNHGFDYYFGYNRWECPFYNSEHIWEDWTYTGLQARYNTELFTDKAIGFIRRARREGKPFLVEIAYHAVHGPLEPKAPEEYFSRFPAAAYELQNFYAHVNAVDTAVDRLRREIGPEWDNTLLLFCSDNGAPESLRTPLPGNAPHRGHKGSFLQGGFRVPLLAHWPVGFRGGQQRNEIVSLVDLMPTALDAAGVAAPSSPDGRSLRPLLEGRARRVHDHLVWAGIHARAWGFTGETVLGSAEQRREESPGAWVVTDGRYLLRFVTTTPPGLFRDLPEGAPPRYELYDVREDPGETRDLAAQIPQVVEGLREIYEQETRDFPPPARWREDRWRELVMGARRGRAPASK